MSSLRRGAVATIAAVAAVSLLAGCGESQSESTFGPMENVEYSPANGIDLDSTIVKVRNLYALAPEGPIGARLRMTLVNTTIENDALVGATAGRPAVTGRLVESPNGTLEVPAGTTVIVGSDRGAQITFPGLEAKAGHWMPVTLLFRSGRAVSGDVLISSPRSEYSDGTLPQTIRTSAPVDSILPSGEAGNPVVEGAEIEQGETDQGNNNSDAQH